MTGTTTQWAVEAHGLTKKFGDNLAVDSVDLKVRTGSIYGFLGPNGAGKTTTMRVLATLLKADGGTAKIFGYDIARQAQQVRQLIGLTGQYASVDEDLTALENLDLFGRLQGMSRRAARARGADLLADFALSEAAHRPLKKFSGGMRRRLDLAASLITSPPLVFLDEPTTGLDPRTRNQMWDTIRTLVAAGVTVLLTTQYLDEADQLADRIAVIDRGRIVAEGTANDLKASVGASTLELRLADQADTARAAAIMTKVLGAPAKAHEAGLIAPLSNVDNTANLLTALKAEHITLSALSVAQPTLDEVFLSLTGHAATSDQPQPQTERTAS